MKKIFFLLSAILLGIISFTLYNCKEDTKESCLQDELCTAKYVTVCCDDNDVCVFKYDGKEYSEDQEDEVAQLLGCGTTSQAFKSANANDLKVIVERLRALVQKTRNSL